MRLLALVFLSILVFSFTGCKDKGSITSGDDDTELQPVETITGSLTVDQQWQGENIVIAFLPDYFIFYNIDTITGIDDDPPYTITKKTTVTSVSGSEQYSLNIPIDKDATRELIAWVDMDKDGLLNFSNDDAARFPSIQYDGKTVQVTRWVYGINGVDNSFSLVLEHNGLLLTNDFLFDIRGEGFNFEF